MEDPSFLPIYSYILNLELLNSGLLENDDIILWAIGQELSSSATYDTEVGVWGDGFLYEGAKVG